MVQNINDMFTAERLRQDFKYLNYNFSRTECVLIKLAPPRTRKDAAALDVKTNVALIYLKRKKESVFMILIYEKRERRKERTVLLLLLFNTVSDDDVIILKSTIYRDVFHSRKSLYASLWNVTILFTWYNITLFLYCHWCTCHCFFVFCFFCMTRRNVFLFFKILLL